ncbi:MAG: serine/threonine protein kinase, partial [bacterium]
MHHLSDKALGRLKSIVAIPDFSETRYRVLEKIGEGGMGMVFRAVDHKLGRKVALKVLDASGQENELAGRMRQEARIIANLEHPGIIPIHDIGILPDGSVYYAMKLVHGDRLDAYRRKHENLPELLRIFEKICETVAFAHAHDIIHRDLKPENIMVGAFGEVLVMDWGLAKILSDEKADPACQKDGHQVRNGSHNEAFQPIDLTETLHGAVLGTPSYMAPEQENGEIEKIDQRTDVFSLGAILAFLIDARSTAGKPGRKQNTNNAFMNDQVPNAPKRRKIHRHLASICHKAMSLAKENRYANAQELALDIERFLDGLPVSAYRDNLLERIWRWLARYKFLIFIV